MPELVEELRVTCTLRHFTVRPNLNQYCNTMTGLVKASDFAYTYLLRGHDSTHNMVLLSHFTEEETKTQGTIARGPTTSKVTGVSSSLHHHSGPPLDLGEIAPLFPPLGLRDGRPGWRPAPKTPHWSHSPQGGPGAGYPYHAEVL